MKKFFVLVVILLSILMTGCSLDGIIGGVEREVESIQCRDNPCYNVLSGGKAEYMPASIIHSDYEGSTSIEYFEGFGDGYCMNPVTPLSYPLDNPLPCNEGTKQNDTPRKVKTHETTSDNSPIVTSIQDVVESPAIDPPSNDTPPQENDPQEDTACKNKNSGKDGTPNECNAGGGQEKHQTGIGLFLYVMYVKYNRTLFRRMRGSETSNIFSLRKYLRGYDKSLLTIARYRNVTDISKFL